MYFFGKIFLCKLRNKVSIFGKVLKIKLGHAICLKTVKRLQILVELNKLGNC